VLRHARQPCRSCVCGGGGGRGEGVSLSTELTYSTCTRGVN
jgi:hypothetical protein